MNQVSLIALLPPELCNQLCGYLDPNSIVNVLSLNHHVRQKLLKGGGLKDLSLVFPPSSHPPAWPSKFVSQFPNLRSLTVALPGDSATTHFRMSLQNEDVKALPRNLQALSLIFECDLSNHQISLLPSNLLRLAIPICTSLTTACLEALPRSLLQLELPKAWKIKDGAISSLPDLTVLDLASAELTDAYVSQLPNSLTSLSLEKSSRLTPEALGRLPPHLVELKAIRVLRYMNDDQATHLPVYLRSLNLGYNNLLTDIGLSRLPRMLEQLKSGWNEKVSANAFRCLPPSLRDLDVGWPNISDLSFHDLPKNLTSLQITSMLVTDACFALLPSSLTSLAIVGAMDITDTGMRKLKVPLLSLVLPNALLTPDCLAHVPRTVQKLELGKRVWSELRRNDLSHLPPALTALDVGRNEWLKEDALEALPRGLMSFSAETLEISNAERFADLPPSLTRLKACAHPDLSETMWQLLSPHIQYLYLPGVTHKPRIVPSLPPSLKELTFAIALPNQQPLDPEHWGPLPSSLHYIRCSPNRCFRRNHSGSWIPVDQPGITGIRRYR